MNAHRTAILTHFGPLFAIALGGWTAFNLVDNGTVHLLPGMVVALILAYAGTLVALRTRTAPDLRATYPQARTTGAFAIAPTQRATTSRPVYAPRDEMDIAAGD